MDLSCSQKFKVCSFMRFFMEGVSMSGWDSFSCREEAGGWVSSKCAGRRHSDSLVDGNFPIRYLE